MRVCALILAAAAQVAAFRNPAIVFIGDPHLNQQTAAATWIAQTNWIAANASTWNIQAVLCAGDFDGFGGDPTANLTAAWSDGWNTIDGLALPYLSAVGNHDYANNDPSTRDSTVFDAQIGYSRINGKTWWGGYYNDGASSKANQYILATVGAHNLLIIALELYPRPAAMAWADGVVLAHLDREIVVITHGYMNPGGALTAWGDEWGPTTYSLPSDAYDGIKLQQWAAKYPNNVHLVLCGHNFPPDFFQRLDGRVYGILSDYQDASPPSQSILIIAFTDTSITVNNLNTTTGTLDTTTFPPFTLAWPVAPLTPTYTLIH